MADSDSDQVMLIELGKLAVLAGNIERHMASIAAVLVSPDQTGVGDIVVANQQFSSLAQMTTKIVVERLGADGSPAMDLLQPVGEWIEDARRFMGWRNNMLHPTWMFTADGRSATLLKRGKRGSETEEVGIQKLRGYVSEGEAIAHRGGDLWEELLLRYGFLNGLLEASKNSESGD